MCFSPNPAVKLMLLRMQHSPLCFVVEESEALGHNQLSSHFVTAPRAHTHHAIRGVVSQTPTHTISRKDPKRKTNNKKTAPH